MDALEKPGGRTPMGLGGPPQGLQRQDPAIDLGTAHLPGEFGVALGFAANGDRIAADVVGGDVDVAAGRDQGADLAAFFVVEKAWSAGHGTVAEFTVER